MQGRKPAVARGRPRIGACVEQVAHDLAPFEESGEAERGVAVGRHAVRLRGIRSHELADAGEIAGRGGLEHVELRPAAKDRCGNLVPAAVQRGKDGGEALLITRVDQPSIRLEESFDRRPVAAFNRGEQIGRHLGPPCN